jgi:hypothetical protein
MNGETPTSRGKKVGLELTNGSADSCLNVATGKLATTLAFSRDRSIASMPWLGNAMDRRFGPDGRRLALFDSDGVFHIFDAGEPAVTTAVSSR